MIKELFFFLVTRRKYALMPIVFVMLVLGAFLALGSNPAITPFLYALF